MYQNVSIHFPAYGHLKYFLFLLRTSRLQQIFLYVSQCACVREFLQVSTPSRWLWVHSGCTFNCIKFCQIALQRSGRTSQWVLGDIVSLTRSIWAKRTLPTPAWPDRNWQVAVIPSSIITAAEWADLCPQKTLTGSCNVLRILCDEIFNPSLPYMAGKWLAGGCVSRTHLSESQPTLLHNWTTFCKFN